MTTSTASPRPRSDVRLLKAAIFTTGTAGIVAEYSIATLAAYLLGDAVVQWAMVISVMLFAMGLGSWLSRRIETRLLDAFVATEIGLSLACGSSALLVYGLKPWVPAIGVPIYGLALLIGVLIGMEIPLLTRLNERHEELRVNISNVMQWDYFGALIGGVLFSFVALPHLGLTYTPLVLGAVNLLVAGLLLRRARAVSRHARPLAAAMAVVAALLATGAATAEAITLFGEQARYRDKVIYSEQSRYQRIVMTQWRGDVWLYLDGHTQFSTFDEHRYHEPLVHPAMLAGVAPRSVLVLGGGDGMAVREILRHDPERVTLVDLDPAVTRLARTHEVLLEHNRRSLHDPRVEVVNADAFSWLEREGGLFDVIVIDFPDPRSVDLARLYSVEFYRQVRRHLSVGGVMVTQAGSPMYAPKAFMSILATVEAADLSAVPMHANIASMGEWGWVVGRNDPAPDAERLARDLRGLDFEGLGTRFLHAGVMPGLLAFGADTLAEGEGVRVNRLNDLRVQGYYRDASWELY